MREALLQLSVQLKHLQPYENIFGLMALISGYSIDEYIDWQRVIPLDYNSVFFGLIFEITEFLYKLEISLKCEPLRYRL